MVVPVPIVLRKENVKTLPREVFDRVDRLTAPRLVEYWEQDPCPKPSPVRAYPASASLALDGVADMRGRGAGAPPPVKIEAQFTVGEYDIVVLSATDSTALDTWLRQNGYKIPAGAEPYLRPYVQMGMKFFVAKVDVAKVKFERTGSGPEQAALSPLRFHYDSDTFSLPIRLGLINSSGTQDLVVTVLSPGQRYEVANYDNVAVPTNVDVSDATRNQFASFYATLFDETVQRHPRSVVTEYSWAANSCDPCPTPPLEQSDLMTLGADVLPSAAPAPTPGSGAPVLRPMRRPTNGNFVITRLHARYSRDALGDDLVFRAAAPIVGGREFMQNDGKLEQGARPDSSNNFQARYVIRHPWTGPMACKNPTRGVWGGPPGRDPWSSGSPEVKAASKIGLLPRAGVLSLASFVRGAMPPESLLSNGGPTPFLGVQTTAMTIASVPDTGAPDADASTPATPYDASPAPPLPPSAPVKGGCVGCAAAPSNAPATGALVGLAAVLVARLRRRRK
jgi:MYXO-CTERM domain-containing protein